MITTSRRIDRERLCPTSSGEVACLAEFDVAVRPLEYFQIVKVGLKACSIFNEIV